MAKRKINIRSKSRRKPKRRLRWLFYFILLVIILGLLLWRGEAIALSVAGIGDKILELLGWGLVLILIAIGSLAWVLWRGKLSSLIYHWNQWLGGIAFILASWGILSLFNLGGSFGLSLINYPALGFIGIVGLVIIGIILVAPRACFRFVINSISWLGKITSRPKKSFPQLTPKPPKPEKETVTPEQQELKQVAQEVGKKYDESPITIDGWRLPPIDILDKAAEIEFSQADNIQRAKLIEEALASYGVEAKVVQINAGPTVTQFGVEPGWDRKWKEVKERDRDGNIKVHLEEVSKTRVKVERITSLANDLALALATPIRIEAPVPGKSVVGIEVPNTTSSLVSLRGVIETSLFQKIKARSKLALALGKGAGGEAVAADLSRMPHLLIAGATGSGKTVCLNSIICCLILHNTPSEVQFIMIDPKRVELTLFNSIPHLATPVIVDTNKALTTLRWLNQEMDKRYQKLATAGARNIEGYNKKGDERLPYLILIIDELADLMMAGVDEVEHILCRLAQLARATGIHLIVATQRPSVDVVTGLIKANFPTRISFAVTSQVDSRTILDTGGAEKLLGKGDMLYMPTEAAKPKRLQGCYVSDAEMERLVYFWSSQRREEVAQLKIEEVVPATRRDNFPEDPLLETAKRLKQEHKHISTSFLQRRLRIGYPRAARIMEQLEDSKKE
ncbi:DNA translocase FtsK [Dehalococcoidales bacterium]|nr:DNA translocase FtsK [Dehalococcoidales bacterium]